MCETEPKNHDARIEVIALGRAHVARCDCGWKSAIMPTYSAANAAIDQHFLDVFGPLECDLRQQEPFDFAWCVTHDRTFPLGGDCPQRAVPAG